MTLHTAHGLELPHLSQELVRDRIQNLHREAEEQRLIARLERVRRARRDLRRATERLHRALTF
ncbi:hypothetical protein [Nonomuraea sp. NPDC050310]|uniref:hypothetical protein n=1 Tax=unclassified Nonomuraea TaxID=2593643 RepID=UPI00340DD00A